MNYKEKNRRFIISSKIKILISILLMILTITLGANGMSESERLQIIEEAKPYKDIPTIDEGS